MNAISPHLKKCSVIIVTYNGKKEWYDKCFQSLLASSIPLDIIVVDNKSTDDSVDYITTNFPKVSVVKSNENFGFARANNIGFNLALNAGSDYFFLLNQDAWVEYDTIETLITTAEKNQGFGILSPIHLTADKSSFDKGFRNSFNDRSDTAFAYEDLYLNKQPDIYETREVPAAAWLVTRQCVEVVGGFDTILFKHYGEDNNYSQRVLFHKLKIGIVPATTICHDRAFRKKKTFNRSIRYAINLGNILMTRKMYLKYLFKTFFKVRQTYFIAVNLKKIMASRKTNKKKGGGMLYIQNSFGPN